MQTKPHGSLMVSVSQHKRDIAEQRETLLSQVEGGMAVQEEQAARKQKALAAERRAELHAVREGLDLRVAQLREELDRATRALEVPVADEGEMASLQEELRQMSAELAELRRKWAVREREAEAELLETRQQLKAVLKQLGEVHSERAERLPRAAAEERLRNAEDEARTLGVEQCAISKQVDELAPKLDAALQPRLKAAAGGDEAAAAAQERCQEIAKEAGPRRLLWDQCLSAIDEGGGAAIGEGGGTATDEYMRRRWQRRSSETASADRDEIEDEGGRSKAVTSAMVVGHVRGAASLMSRRRLVGGGGGGGGAADEAEDAAAKAEAEEPRKPTPLEMLHAALWKHVRLQQAHRTLVKQLATLRRCHRRTEHADQSVAVDLSCPVCFRPMPVPYLLWPCGHSFCGACAGDMAERDECDECGAEVKRSLRNPLAAHIGRTFLDRQVVLQQTAAVLAHHASDSIDELMDDADEELFEKGGGGVADFDIDDILNITQLA